MSIQSLSSGGGSNWSYGSLQQTGRKPPEFTKDQLTQLDQQLKAAGKDTTDLDKVIANFNQVDANQDGSVSIGEIKQDASTLGISMPKGGHGHHHHGGPPPTDSQDSSSTSTTGPTSLMDSILPNGGGPPPGMFGSDSSGGCGSDSSTSGTSSASGTSGSGKSNLLSQLLQAFSKADPSSTLADELSNGINIAA